MNKLKEWYFGINKKQRIIVWIVSLLVCATNPIGWLFFAWWWLPLLTFMEYKRA